MMRSTCTSPLLALRIGSLVVFLLLLSCCRGTVSRMMNGISVVVDAHDLQKLRGRAAVTTREQRQDQRPERQLVQQQVVQSRPSEAAGRAKPITRAPSNEPRRHKGRRQQQQQQFFVTHDDDFFHHNNDDNVEKPFLVTMGREVRALLHRALNNSGGSSSGNDDDEVSVAHDVSGVPVNRHRRPATTRNDDHQQEQPKEDRPPPCHYYWDGRVKLATRRGGEVQGFDSFQVQQIELVPGSEEYSQATITAHDDDEHGRTTTTGYWNGVWKVTATWTDLLHVNVVSQVNVRQSSCDDDNHDGDDDDGNNDDHGVATTFDENDYGVVIVNATTIHVLVHVKGTFLSSSTSPVGVVVYDDDFTMESAHALDHSVDFFIVTTTTRTTTTTTGVDDGMMMDDGGLLLTNTKQSLPSSSSSIISMPDTIMDGDLHTLVQLLFTKRLQELPAIVALQQQQRRRRLDTHGPY